MQSSLAQPGTPCVVVEPITQCPCPRRGRGVNQAKPSGVAVDDALWSDFAGRINPLVRQINYGMLTLNFVYVVGIIAIFVTSWVILVPFYVFIGLMAMFALTIIYNLFRNASTDEKIQGVLEELRPRFEAAGYSVDYRTQHTVPIMNRQRPERVIIFTCRPGLSVETGDLTTAAGKGQGAKETSAKEANAANAGAGSSPPNPQTLQQMLEEDSPMASATEPLPSSEV